jgi:hypothetical protein
MLKSWYSSGIQQTRFRLESRRAREYRPMKVDASVTRRRNHCSTLFAAPSDVKRYNMQVDMPEQRGLSFEAVKSLVH